MIARTVIRPSFYQDSVALLGVARELRGGAGIQEGSGAHGHPANRELLEQAGLLTAEAAGAGPNRPRHRGPRGHRVRRDRRPGTRRLASRRAPAAHRDSGRGGARTPLDSARRQLDGANLALISVPGPFAAAEARKALTRGLHVMPLQRQRDAGGRGRAEARLAGERGLLLMGPDWRYRVSQRRPAGFANVVPRGRVGPRRAPGHRAPAG